MYSSTYELLNDLNNIRNSELFLAKRKNLLRNVNPNFEIQLKDEKNKTINPFSEKSSKYPQTSHQPLHLYSQTHQPSENLQHPPHTCDIATMHLSHTWWKHLVAGGIAGSISRTCTAPLDRIKIFKQVSTHEKFKLRQALMSMLHEGGVRSLWRGNFINVLKIVPEAAIRFALYDELKRNIMSMREKTTLTMSDRMLAGGLAGFISQSFVYPLEVMKTRLALRPSHKTPWHCVQDICKQGATKPTSFYIGFTANIVAGIPYAAIDLSIYETLKGHYMKKKMLETNPNKLVLLSCGVVSSSLAQVIIYPMSLVKVRTQATLVNSDCHRLSVFQKLSRILQTEGFRGLYSGLLANLMKVAPNVAITYVVYEAIRQHLDAPMS